MYESCLAMPKADLHIHLNGAIPTTIIKKLIETNNISIPGNFDLNSDLQILSPAESLSKYFKPWHALKLLPKGQECLKEMVKEIFPYLQKENIKYVEFRNSPFNICDINHISLEEALTWLTDSIVENSNLFNIKANLIISISRFNFNFQKSADLLKAIKKVNSPIIVGLDLSGDEDTPIPKEAIKLFEIARNELGLGVSIHAGETWSLDSLNWVLDNCNPDRIAHGLAAIKSIRTLEKLKEKNICIEICLISNLRTGNIKNISEHPITTFIEWEIPFVLCTDNPQIHGASLTDEYVIFAKEYGHFEMLEDMYNLQMKFAFSKED